MSTYQSMPYDPNVPPKPAPFAEPPPPSRKGCGCMSCAMGCLVVVLLLGVASFFAARYAFSRLPDWSRAAIVSSIDGSDLPPAQKQRIVAQVDRVVDEYKAGRASLEQVQQVLQELTESPLFSLAIAYAATEKYIEPSGFAEDEKRDAKIAVQRVARGIFEKQIPPEKLDPALDYISKKDEKGNRQFAHKVTDQELRAMVAECRRIADDAKIPDGPFEIDAAAEIEKAVDRALAKKPGN
jgi:hypothetical protein